MIDRCGAVIASEAKQSRIPRDGADGDYSLDLDAVADMCHKQLMTSRVHIAGAGIDSRITDPA